MNARIALKFACLWALFIAVVFSSFSSFAQPKGAVCIINADNQIVVVDEILTGKVSLPAGTIADDEPPQDAAQREAWEETGLVVSVERELGRSEKAIYYQCVSNSDIIVFAQQDNQGSRTLPNWFAPHYGIEVSGARLIDPARLDAAEYRYPQQWSYVEELFKQTSAQPVSYVNNLFDATSRYHQVELNSLLALQLWVNNLPSSVSRFVDSFLLTGLVFTSSWWLIFLLPVCYRYLDRDFTLKLLFTLMMTTLLVQIGQQGFAQPRPYAFLPLLNRASEVGFGLPNLALALWVASATMLMKKSHFLGWNKVSLVVTVVLVWMTLGLYYSGSAFILDGVSGGIVGLLTAWHMMRLEQKLGQDSDGLFHRKGVWWLLVVGYVVVLLWWQTPTLLSLVLSLVVIALLQGNLPQKMDTRSMMTVMLGLLVTSGVMFALHGQVSDSNASALVVKSLQWPVMILVSAMFLILNKTKAKTNP